VPDFKLRKPILPDLIRDTEPACKHRTTKAQTNKKWREQLEDVDALLVKPHQGRRHHRFEGSISCLEETFVCNAG
jgi:hypothetical protein